MASETRSSQGEGKLRQTMLQLDATMREFTEAQRKAARLDASIFMSFLKGIASGLGVLMAVAIVVPILLASLRSINWVPIIGKFVSDIATQIEQHAQHQ